MRIIMRQWILLIICLGLCAGFVRAQAVGAVSGRVVESGVTGIAGAEVVVYGINYNYLSSGTTDAGGYYNLPDVAVGECKVHFPAGSAGNYQHQWYNGKHFFDEADTIIVTENSTTLLPTVILEPGGIISGRVLDEQGNGLAGVYVEVHVIDSTMGWGNTDENGYFTVNALPGKECRIYFDTFGTSNHTPEWYNDKKSFDEADWVYVNVGQTVELRDTVLSRGGILSGLLMAEYGSIYGDAYVEVYDESNNFIRSVMVGEDDGYRVDGLPAGTYKLKFTTYGGTLYLDEWYQNKATFETADPIVLAGGETLDLGTEILDKAVDIGGDVKDSRGNGIAGVYVGVYDLDYNYMGSTYTDEIGDFRIRGLEHRDSKIYFEPGGAGNCLPQWLRRKETFEEADIMETSSGSMTFSSVILEDGGGVSGRMTDAGGNGVPNARVDVFNTDYDYLAGAVTDENGDYNVNGIPQGLCKINFSGSSGNYLSEWYNDKADFDHADTVMVTVGQTVTINAQLATGGGLSGRVTASTGTGLADVQVTVHGSGGDYVNSIFSDSEGYYTMEGIAPGVCKVFFDTYAAGNYVGQWYNNKNSYEAADEIGITAGQTTILEDARLESGGMISGRVTDIVGNGLSQVYVYVYGPEYDFKGMTVTDDTGYYSVQHLKVGESKILFEPYMAGNYTTQWYNNRDSFINADAVYVNAGQQLTVENTVLNEGAVINGRIADAGGNGIGDVFVDVYDYAYNYLGGTFSNGDGYYSVTALPTSNCKIYFAADTTNVYISEWYNDKRDFFDADVVALAMGQGITLEDAVLDKGVVLRGRITDGNAGIANAAVNLYDLSYTHIAMGTSDYNGNFTLSGLPSATYKAYVEADGFIKQWYNDTYSFENADVIVLDISDKTLEDIVLVRGGTLGGRVTDDQGVGVPDIAVNVYDRDYNYLSSVITDAAGSYSLSGLPGVDCKIFFSTDGNRAFLGEWYNDKADFDSADFISIALGGTTVLSDAVLVRGGIINGRVVNEQGRGIPDISVTAFDSAYYYRGYAYTDANGYYTMPGLKGGMVKVYFDAYAAGNYQSEWYDNKASFETADFVSVNAGASTVVPDAVLSVAARISGRAINAQGVGIPGVLVTLYETHYYFMESTPTDSSGNFTLEGLPAVQCKIEFQAWDTVVYLSEWYNDKGSFDDADLVTLNTGGNLVLDDTVLREGGTVTGRVLDEGGRGMGGIYITAYDENYYYLGDADCDADGHYSLQGLPAGNCKIFYDVNEGNYLSQWYRDKKIFDDADPVMINPGITTSLPDVVLREGGMIRGKVTAGMSNCDVTVFDENYMYVTFAMPGNDGSYQLEGIPTGRYYVHFASYDANYISQWYNGKASFDEADAVDVRKGSTTNLRKTRLEPGGVIKGRVLDAGGNGIANIYVEVFDENGFYLSGDETAPDGNFFVPGLTTGVCKIAFNCYGTGNYVDEWYDDKDGMDSADVFRATAGREYELPDVVLADGAKIRGTITNGGMGLEGIYAIAFRLSDGASWYAFSDSSGDYAIYNLPAAEYKVRFQSHSNYISEWYNDRPDEASADILGLAEGRELPGIDAEMQLGGSIKGTVTDSTGNPLAMVDVVVKTDDEEAYWAITDGLGNYTVDVLPTGTYKTLFDPGYLNYYYDPTDSNNYVYQWYDNAETFNTAANIQVNVSQTVSGLDARLQEGGSITGNITNFNGDPVSNANIRVYRTGMEDVGYTLNVFSDGMGSYRVKGLVAGDYFVVFDALNLGYDLEYYDNAATEAEATPVSVPATGQVTGIDAVLNQ